MTNPRGGPVLPVTVRTDSPIGGAALPVTLLTSIPADRRLEGGPARPVVYITAAQVAAGYPVQAGDATPIYAVTDGRRVLAGRPQAVYVVGGSGPTPPPDPNAPLADYRLWLNPNYRPDSAFQDAARTIPATVGDPIGGLYDDTTGITATASGAARPLRTATGMSFDGAQFLDVLSGLSLTSASGFTILCTADVPTGFIVTFYQFAASIPGVRNDGPNLTRLGNLYFSPVAMFGGISVPLPTSAKVLSFRHTSAVRTAYVNAALAGTEATAVAINTQQRLRIGGEFNSEYNLVGALREILVYASALSDAALNAEIAKAATRCGVTL